MLIKFLNGTEREIELEPGAYLTSANLTRANLRGANLTRANLRGANLTSADLTSADLTRAYLWAADLWAADLTGANLRDADLTGANLRDANLRGAVLPFVSSIPARELRLLVAAQIEAHPELHDQTDWGDGEADPTCQTPCCVAGWACQLGGGRRGLTVETAATLLLRGDGAAPVPFEAGATRDEILTALRLIPVE